MKGNLPLSLLRSGQSQAEVSIPLSKITRRAASWEPQTISLQQKTIRKHKKVRIFSCHVLHRTVNGENDAFWCMQKVFFSFKCN